MRSKNCATIRPMKRTLEGQGFIELVDSMGSDASIVKAARVSYDGDERERTEQQDAKLLRYLLKNKHTSPFEHVTLTFHVKAPIFVVRQWMRHRTWSFNEISARYTEVDQDYYVPDYWREQSSSNKQMSEGSFANAELSEGYMNALNRCWDVYHSLIDAGVAREMARMILPVSSFTRFYATVDLHNLLHFITLRKHEHSQNEIQEYARAMLDYAIQVAPITVGIWQELNDE